MRFRAASWPFCSLVPFGAGFFAWRKFKAYLARFTTGAYHQVSVSKPKRSPLRRVRHGGNRGQRGWVNRGTFLWHPGHVSLTTRRGNPAAFRHSLVSIPSFPCENLCKKYVMFLMWFLSYAIHANGSHLVIESVNHMGLHAQVCGSSQLICSNPIVLTMSSMSNECHVQHSTISIRHST